MFIVVGTRLGLLWLYDVKCDRLVCMGCLKANEEILSFVFPSTGCDLMIITKCATIAVIDMAKIISAKVGITETFNSQIPRRARRWKDIDVAVTPDSEWCLSRRKGGGLVGWCTISGKPDFLLFQNSGVPQSFLS
jgi:hypothetical protein